MPKKKVNSRRTVVLKPTVDEEKVKSLMEQIEGLNKRINRHESNEKEYIDTISRDSQKLERMSEEVKDYKEEKEAVVKDKVGLLEQVKKLIQQLNKAKVGDPAQNRRIFLGNLTQSLLVSGHSKEIIEDIIAKVEGRGRAEEIINSPVFKDYVPLTPVKRDSRTREEVIKDAMKKTR